MTERARRKARSQRGTTSTRAPRTDAPPFFLALRGEVGKNRKLLDRLCAVQVPDHPLNVAWRRLAKHLETEAACHRLWGLISDAYSSARREPQLRARQAAVAEIAAAAEALRSLVEGDVDFDRLVHVFFPADLIRRVGAVADTVDPPWQLGSPGEHAGSWPSLTEVLTEIRDRAVALQPRQAMREHLAGRMRARLTGHVDPWTFFARRLDYLFRRNFGKPYTPAVEALTRAAFAVPASWSAKKAIDNARPRKSPRN